MKIRALLTIALVAFSLVAQTQTHQTTVSLGRLFNHPGLGPLLQNEAFYGEALRVSGEEKINVGAQLELVGQILNDTLTTNEFRTTKLNELLGMQAKALNSFSPGAEQQALAELFLEQTRAIAGTSSETLAVFEIAGLIETNEQILAKERGEALVLAAQAEREALANAVRNSAASSDALHKYLFEKEGIKVAPNVAGAVTMEYLSTTSEVVKDRALAFIKLVTPQETLDATLNGLGNLREQAQFEGKLFLQEFKNNPMTTANVMLGLGTLVVGGMTGSPLLMGSAVWSVFGNRIMAHVPTNSILISMAEMSIKISNLRSADTRNEVIAEYKAKAMRVASMPVEVLGSIHGSIFNVGTLEKAQRIAVELGGRGLELMTKGAELIAPRAESLLRIGFGFARRCAATASGKPLGGE